MVSTYDYDMLILFLNTFEIPIKRLDIRLACQINNIMFNSYWLATWDVGSDFLLAESRKVATVYQYVAVWKVFWQPTMRVT